MSNISGNSLINGISNNLVSTYAQIASFAGSGGVTPASIAKARTDKDLSSSLNQSFANYLQTNFGSMDKNGDGKITPDEMTTTSSMLNTTGLTSAQLTQLGTASGLSQEALSQVLAHFSDIDTNHDGKVTIAEINAYNTMSDKMKIQDEYRLKAASDMSMFYGSETSSDSQPSSIMSYKYLD